MADTDRPAATEHPVSETDTVQADRAREQGQGLGEHLGARRDPGDVRAADETSDVEGGVEPDPGDADADGLNQSVEAEGDGRQNRSAVEAL